MLQLMVPAESAHDTIAGLGEVGLLQFKDLASDKSAFQRTYASQVRPAGLVLAGTKWHVCILSHENGHSGCSEGFPTWQVKRCDEMSRKLRFFTEQVCC